MSTDPQPFSTKIENNLSRLFGLKGRTALVTGAASGLGQRIAAALYAVGADVYFADINKAAASTAAQEAKALNLGDARKLSLDVTDPGSVATAFNTVSEENGRLDIVVNAAGISGAKWIEDMSLDLWNRILAVNLTGTFLCCREAVRVMRPRHWGRIINVASIAATHAPRPERFNGGYNYSASKAGVVGLTRRLAVELAPYHITANTISPGFMQTPLTAKAFSDATVLEQALETTPLKRLGSASDLDGLVVYISSESSAFLTGQDIIIDGGYSVW